VNVTKWGVEHRVGQLRGVVAGRPRERETVGERS